MAVTALVLLIACANAASLLLARASARQREISVRLAIGAGRGRIIRQLLTESTLLSLLGAALGVFLAWITSRFLVDILAGSGHTAAPSLVAFDLTPNWHVLGFASAVAIANGILFGLAPAFQTTAIGGSRVIKDDTRIARARSRVLSSLVAAQVALSLLLLVGAGLFARTLQNLLNVDPGFRREGVLLVEVDGQREGYRDARLTAFYRGLLERVRQVPGVVSASISSHTPLSGATWSEAVVPKGQPLPERDNAVFIAAGPGFFGTMQTPLISGRDFDERDQGSPNVAIVNQAFAVRFYPSRNSGGPVSVGHRDASRERLTDCGRGEGRDHTQLAPACKADSICFLLSTGAPRRHTGDSRGGISFASRGGDSHAAPAEFSEHGARCGSAQRSSCAKAGTGAADGERGRWFRGARAGPGVRRTIWVAGLQRRPADQGNRHPHGTGGTTARAAVDDHRAGTSSSGGGCGCRFTGGLDGLAMATIDAVRLDADGPRRNRRRDCVAGNGGDAGCVLSGKTGHASGSHHCFATRVSDGP